MDAGLSHPRPPRRAGGRSSLFLGVALIPVCVAAAEPPVRWWPRQNLPRALVCTDLALMKPVAEPGGRQPSVWLGQEHMLATSVAGLAAQAVNDGKGDELVWIELRNDDYRLWFQSLTNRLGVAVRGVFPPWELVRRFAEKGIVKGYVLYTCDPSSGGATRLRPGRDESANVATTVAGLLGGVLVSEGQEAQARELGLKKLFDARGKTEAWCFAQYRDRLNRRFALLQDPQMPHCRDLAIAHRMMVMFGPESPTPEVYARLQPLSSILGWNGGDEGHSVAQLSRAGHILLPCNWSMNLGALSAGSDAWNGGGQFRSLDPRQIQFDDGKHAVAFIMSDGDNVQWLMGAFCGHHDYWASPDHGRFPIGWGAALGCLDQCSPDTLAYLKQTQRPEATIIQHGGGYFYPDLLGIERGPDVRRRILTEHARRVNHYLRRSGGRTYQFIMMNLESPGAREAYGIFARELEDLLGMFALQYHPYEAGNGKVFWIPNGRGDEVPVVTAKYSLWADMPASKARAGTPAKIARAINADARAHTNALLHAWCVTHAWSVFPASADPDEPEHTSTSARNGHRAVTPTRWALEQLDPSVKVVSPEELLWRLRWTHAPDRTAAQIQQTTPTARAELVPHQAASQRSGTAAPPDCLNWRENILQLNKPGVPD